MCIDSCNCPQFSEETWRPESVPLTETIQRETGIERKSSGILQEFNHQLMKTMQGRPGQESGKRAEPGDLFLGIVEK